MNSFRGKALRLILPLLVRRATVDFFVMDEDDFFAEDLAVVDREDELEEACAPFWAISPAGSMSSTNSTMAILARWRLFAEGMRKGVSNLTTVAPWQIHNLHVGADVIEGTHLQRKKAHNFRADQ